MQASVENKIVNETLPPKLKELQQKIQDEEYISYAVNRIAVVMSKRIIDMHDSKKNSII